MHDYNYNRKFFILNNIIMIQTLLREMSTHAAISSLVIHVQIRGSTNVSLYV